MGCQLTDYREFGTWFRVRLEGPFAVGQVTRGVIAEPGYEGMAFMGYRGGDGDAQPVCL